MRRRLHNSISRNSYIGHSQSPPPPVSGLQAQYLETHQFQIQKKSSIMLVSVSGGLPEGRLSESYDFRVQRPQSSLEEHPQIAKET
ncbi:hypothetical protein V6N13_048562 [Hibiscus sabdariffa]|uniref:Uncharacterized protein n=1 Tax=Hibiscus sabdariffa TaxID=183260 RepID=A0ABR2F7L2_9ROSI